MLTVSVADTSCGRFIIRINPIFLNQIEPASEFQILAEYRARGGECVQRTNRASATFEDEQHGLREKDAVMKSVLTF